MLEHFGNDFDSDCSTPTRYLNNREIPRSTTADEYFFTAIHSPSFQYRKVNHTTISSESLLVTSIDSSSLIEESRNDLMINRIVFKHQPSRDDGSTVFYDACDNIASKGKFNHGGSDISSYYSCKDQRVSELSNQPSYLHSSKQMYPPQMIRRMGHQENEPIIDQPFDEYYSNNFAYASDNSCSQISQIYFSNEQDSSDISDLYSPSGAETILRPNTFDLSSIWKVIQNWRNLKTNSIKFCSLANSCQSPHTPLKNAKNLYHHESHLEQHLPSWIPHDKMMMKHERTTVQDMKTEKRTNTLSNSLAESRNFYIIDETKNSQNGEFDIYRASLSSKLLESEDCYYNGFDGTNDYYTYISPVQNFNLEKHLGAKRLKANEVNNIRGVLQLNFDDSSDEEAKDVIIVRSPNNKTSTFLNNHDMDSMESNERGIITGYVLSDYPQRVNHRSKKLLNQRFPLQIQQHATSRSYTSLSPTYTTQTNGTRHRRNLSKDCNTFTSESLNQIFDINLINFDKTPPNHRSLIPKTIKTEKKKSRTGIYEDDISPLEGDDDLSNYINHYQSEVDVAVNYNMECSPLNRKMNSFDFTSHIVSTDLFGVRSCESIPVNYPLKIKDPMGFYLATSVGFRSEREQIKSNITFEGWVAFSKGSRLLTSLKEDDFSIQRKDMRYIILSSGKLHVFASKMCQNNVIYSENSKVLKLRKNYTVECILLSKKHGQCVVIKDELGTVKCTILPVNLNKSLFTDEYCSEIISTTEFEKIRHTLFVSDDCDSSESENAWFHDISQTAPFEQNTCVLWIHFAIDSAIAITDRIKHSCNASSCATCDSYESF